MSSRPGREALHATGAPLPVRDDEITARACANALSVDFGTFRSQALSYLELDARSLIVPTIFRMSL